MSSTFIVSTYIPYTILMPNIHGTRSLLVHRLPFGNLDIPQKSVQYWFKNTFVLYS